MPDLNVPFYRYVMGIDIGRKSGDVSVAVKVMWINGKWVMTDILRADATEIDPLLVIDVTGEIVPDDPKQLNSGDDSNG